MCIETRRWIHREVSKVVSSIEANQNLVYYSVSRRADRRIWSTEPVCAPLAPLVVVSAPGGCRAVRSFCQFGCDVEGLLGMVEVHIINDSIGTVLSIHEDKPESGIQIEPPAGNRERRLLAGS